MPQQTAVDFLIEQLWAPCRGIPSHIIEQAKQMERQRLFDAMMYALDEDGHTGDWKVKFINEYYERNFGV